MERHGKLSVLEPRQLNVEAQAATKIVVQYQDISCRTPVYFGYMSPSSYSASAEALRYVVLWQRNDCQDFSFFRLLQVASTLAPSVTLAHSFPYVRYHSPKLYLSRLGDSPTKKTSDKPLDLSADFPGSALAGLSMPWSSNFLSLLIAELQGSAI